MSYAHALFEITQEQQLAGVLPAQLHGLRQAVEQLPHLEAFLQQPGLTDNEKVEALRLAVGDALHPVAMRLLEELVKHNHLGKLSLVVDQYQKMLDKAQQVLPADVQTVVPMTDEQKSRLVETLKQMTGVADVRLTCHVAPNILGGVVLKIQDLVVDGSTRGKLSQLRKQWC